MSTDTPAIVLLLDDDPLVTRNLEIALRLGNAFAPRPFNDPAEALSFLEVESVDAMVVDYQMPQMTGLDFLAQAKLLRPTASRLLLTGYADKTSAIRAINEIGLYQYFEKPWDNAALKLTLRNAVERTRLLRALKDHQTKIDDVRDRLWKLLV